MCVTTAEFAKYVYDIVRLDCEDMDAIYGDYIKQMVGVYGLNALRQHKLVESCGVVNGRQLYVLVEAMDARKTCGIMSN